MILVASTFTKRVLCLPYSWPDWNLETTWWGEGEQGIPLLTKFLQFRATLPGCSLQPANKILDLSCAFSWLGLYSGPQQVKKSLNKFRYSGTHHKPGHRPVPSVSPGACTRRDAVSHHLWTSWPHLSHAVLRENHLYCTPLQNSLSRLTWPMLPSSLWGLLK